MEEEGGFGVYGEKTRYATLQKQKHDVPNNRGYETLRHFRSNIPSLVRPCLRSHMKFGRGVKVEGKGLKHDHLGKIKKGIQSQNRGPSIEILHDIMDPLTIIVGKTSL